MNTFMENIEKFCTGWKYGAETCGPDEEPSLSFCKDCSLFDSGAAKQYGYEDAYENRILDAASATTERRCYINDEPCHPDAVCATCPAEQAYEAALDYIESGRRDMDLLESMCE